ncbi:hypothetical protein BUE80_DR011897 [Diplocarpon rosae]|nr:hypothetical protein BUE80_DR011897 [Diplocarpon rosae]
MTDLDKPALDVDNRPLAVRRPRRCCSIGPNPSSSPREQPRPPCRYGIATPPATPQRRQKRVRFSDPGPAVRAQDASSGLTPFLRRASLTTSRAKGQRRQSTPGRLWHRAGYDVAPASGTVQFAPLRQVLEGRVMRRLRRNRLSEEANAIEGDKRAAAKERKSEVERLRGELAMKDREVQSMRDERDAASQFAGELDGSITGKTRLGNQERELEQEIRSLQEELRRREGDGDVMVEEEADWTMAARDPYEYDGDDDGEVTMPNFDQELQDMSGYDEIMTTPTRLNTSFPSPASTMPNTPCKPVCAVEADMQASPPTPDPEREVLTGQLQSLQSKLQSLTAALAVHADHDDRLAGKLSSFLPAHEAPDPSALDAALDRVLTTLALSQSQAREQRTALAALSTEISSLGFPGRSPDDTLAQIAAQFRRARLELEYLAPGEVAAGFENAGLLELLIERIRALLARVRQQDEQIDEYHAQEVLLREQLNDRVQSQLAATRHLLEEKSTALASLQSSLESRERVHGAALALRDARVAELRREIARLEASLETAQAMVQALHREKADLLGAEERAQSVVREMLTQLGRVGEMGLGFVDEGEARARASSDSPAAVRTGAVGMLDGGRARRGSGSGDGNERKRRRYDSGLGFLEEEAEEEV